MENIPHIKITIFVILIITLLSFSTGCFERNELVNAEDFTDNDLYAVEIIPSVTAIPVGIEYALTAIARYVDGTEKDVSAEALWESGDSFIVQVDTHGKVIGIQPGFAPITAIFQGFTGTSIIEITNATLVSIDITPANPSSPVGLTRQFTATGILSDSSAIDLTEQVTWTSSIQAVASISNTDGTRGLATALGTGTSSIGAEMNGISNSTVFTVTPAELLYIEIEPANPDIQKTKSLQFKAYGHYTDSTVQDMTEGAVWTSSNSSVLTVSDNPGSKGLSTGNALGQSTVMATCGALQGTTLVTVTELMLTKWVDNGMDEPKVITSTDAKFTLAWPALQNAVKYELYYVTKSNPLEETKFMETSATQADVTDNKYMVRIKAMDAVDTIIDTWVIRGSSQMNGKNTDGGLMHILPANFATGNLLYNFDEPALPSYFFSINAAQIELKDGYVQLNQNITDNGPDLGVGYDSTGKRYLHIRFKYYQHRNGKFYGNYYFYPIRVISYMNQNRFLGTGNFHEENAPVYGSYYWYREYDSNDFNPYNDIRQQIDPAEFFDTWITWDFKIDLALGRFTVELFDASMVSVFVTTIDTGRHFGDRIFLFFNPYGWWTGHFVRIDDLLIESSDTPY